MNPTGCPGVLPVLAAVPPSVPVPAATAAWPTGRQGAGSPADALPARLEAEPGLSR